MKRIAVLAPNLAAFQRWGTRKFNDILKWQGSRFSRWSPWHSETYIYEWISSLAQFQAGTWASSVELPGFEQGWSVQDYAELQCALNEGRIERTYHVKDGRSAVKPKLRVEDLDLPWGRPPPTRLGKPLALRPEYRFGTHTLTRTPEPSPAGVASKSRKRRQRYTPPRHVPPLPKP